MTGAPDAGPPDAGPPASLFERLLLLSREAHGLGQHEAAYHALTAAMHAAVDARDARALAEVGREAAAQIAWIDRHARSHRLSTASAAGHQHPGVYAMLARQVTAHTHMLDAPPGRPGAR
nr:c6 zinc finger domain-containing protein [uncultured bacterium]